MAENFKVECMYSQETMCQVSLKTVKYFYFFLKTHLNLSCCRFIVYNKTSEFSTLLPFILLPRPLSSKDMLIKPLNKNVQILVFYYLFFKRNESKLGYDMTLRNGTFLNRV